MDIVGNRTLRRVLEQHAVANPVKVFLTFEDASGRVTQYTYGEFDETVNRTANALLFLGVKRGDRINLHLRNCPEFLFAWLAAAKIGAVIVPTDPRSTRDELVYILGHSEAVISLTEPRALDVVHSARKDCPALRQLVLCRSEGATPETLAFQDLVAEAALALDDVGIQADDEVAIMYTSGTTAKPKGVLITHANYIYGGEQISKSLRLSPEDRHLVALPFFHLGAHIHAAIPDLIVGASMVVTETFSASRFFDQAIRHGCTAAALFGAHLRMLLNQPRRPEHRDNPLRVVTYAQNITEAQIAEWHDRFGAPLLQIWGMTETISLPIMSPLDHPRNLLAMGMVCLGYECKVVDEAGNEVPPGAEGQLAVKGVPGRTLMKGYFKNLQATADTIKDGWLWSGDIVRRDEAGYFYFVDRGKDLIKRAGENISAGEVEAVLRQHPKVFDAAVIGISHPVKDESVKAFVILRPETTASAEELIDWCRARLAGYKVPEVIEFRTEFPRTSVGKIQKHILRRLEQVRAGAEGPGPGGRGPTETGRP